MTRSRPSTRTAAPAGNHAEPLATGHTFRDPALLEQALTHSSLPHEQPATEPAPGGRPVDNEQLEFLGDAVLGLVVAEALFSSFPEAREGDLTRLRASVVSRENLASVAGRLSLGDHLRLGRGEERTGGRSKPALLADALEAVIAALYLDGGLPTATAFIEREVVAPALPEMRRALAQREAIGDFKTALQELLQSTGQSQPRYVLTHESGPDHQRSFRIAVEIRAEDGTALQLAEAEGSTKKRAQQDAARLALDLLKRNAGTAISAVAPAPEEPA